MLFSICLAELATALLLHRIYSYYNPCSMALDSIFYYCLPSLGKLHDLFRVREFSSHSIRI